MDYITRVNKRAKRIKLQFCAYRGLIITSPQKLSEKRLNALCLEHQDWIHIQYAKYPIEVKQSLPTHLNLEALNQSYSLLFCLGVKSKVTVANNKLIVTGKNTVYQLNALKKWIRQQAKQLFTLKLQEWANITNLNYIKLNVRSQKSRWGSCSTSGTISLNDQLLFMPCSVLDYIIVHELCHTVHHNHSPQFWALVAKHSPNYPQQEILLAQFAKQIPQWFRASLFKT